METEFLISNTSLDFRACVGKANIDGEFKITPEVADSLGVSVGDSVRTLKI